MTRETGAEKSVENRQEAPSLPKAQEADWVDSSPKRESASDAHGALPLWKHRDRRRRKPPLLFGTRGPGSLYRKAKSLSLLCTRDRNALLSFLRADFPVFFPLLARLKLVRQFVATTDAIRCFHTQAEMLVVAEELFRRGTGPNGGPVVVEAGVAKGASSAKLSLVVHRLGGQLHLFDSFRGMPQNDEHLTRLDGSDVVFFKGAFTGRIPTVTRALEKFGRPECCHLHKGLFQETMPEQLPEEIDLALLDVDLLSSTQTCVKHIYPRLRAGGVIYSQDGHLRQIVELLGSDAFWRDEVGSERPVIEGLGVRKFLRIQKPLRPQGQ